jgi:hypothetical protein
MARLEGWEKNEGVWNKGARLQVTGGRQASVGQVRTVDTSSPSLAQFTLQSTWPHHAYARRLTVTCCLITLCTIGQVRYFTLVTCTWQNIINESFSLRNLAIQHLDLIVTFTPGLTTITLTLTLVAMRTETRVSTLSRPTGGAIQTRTRSNTS